MADTSGLILFLIPARGGSVRIPDKNLKPVGGIPLVARAVRVARAAAAATSGGPHRVVCSTDDAAIATAAATWGADVLERPVALATAGASSVDVALHALESLDLRGAVATLVLLQPTSPLTDPSDVVAAITRHRGSGGTSVVSVTASHPATWHQAMGGDDVLRPLDDAGRSMVLSGAFYIVRPEDLRRTRRFVEPGRSLGHVVAPERSVDVDEAHELVMAEAILAALPVRPVPLGRWTIGQGRVFVIAEGGVNHNGDVDLAHRLVDAAADAGADAVKFQTFDPDALAAAGAPKAAYQAASGDAATDQREMLARLTLPRDAWAALQTHAHARGIEFLSTPFDDGSAELLDRLGVPAFKVGSGELTNLPFIARLARRGRPMLISTGMAEMWEVAAAVDTVARSGDPPVALLHCVSAYPAAPADANLRAVDTLRRAFRVPVGWSDHTVGMETSLAAVATGAALIEKHLTLDRDLPGPDHRASLEPDDFAAMIEGIRLVEASLGSGVKAPAAAEADVASVARRSLYWRHAMDAGATIQADDLEALRPGSGVAPGRVVDIIGRQTTVRVRAGDAVRETDVEGLA